MELNELGANQKVHRHCLLLLSGGSTIWLAQTEQAQRTAFVGSADDIVVGVDRS